MAYGKDRMIQSMVKVNNHERDAGVECRVQNTVVDCLIFVVMSYSYLLL